jgi:hypothetical protein
MSSERTTRRALPSISQGFVHGLAQMSSVGLARSIDRSYRADSVAESLRGDWVRVGSNMATAIERVRDRGPKKPKHG